VFELGDNVLFGEDLLLKSGDFLVLRLAVLSEGEQLLV
jgi:hypothetical protein